MRFRDDYTGDPAEPTEARPPSAPWDILEHEPAEDYRLLRAFLTAPPGGLAVFAVAQGLALPQVARMATRWRWRARRASYEHALMLDTYEAARESAQEDGARAARMLSLAGAALLTRIEEIAADPGQTQAMDLLACMRSVKTVIELQRLRAGESTVNVVNLDSAPLDRVRALDRALTELALPSSGAAPEEEAN